MVRTNRCFVGQFHKLYNKNCWSEPDVFKIAFESLQSIQLCDRATTKLTLLYNNSSHLPACWCSYAVYIDSLLSHFLRQTSSDDHFVLDLQQHLHLQHVSSYISHYNVLYMHCRSYFKQAFVALSNYLSSLTFGSSVLNHGRL